MAARFPDLGPKSWAPGLLHVPNSERRLFAAPAPLLQLKSTYPGKRSLKLTHRGQLSRLCRLIHGIRAWDCRSFRPIDTGSTTSPVADDGIGRPEQRMSIGEQGLARTRRSPDHPPGPPSPAAALRRAGRAWGHPGHAAGKVGDEIARGHGMHGPVRHQQGARARVEEGTAETGDGFRRRLPRPWPYYRPTARPSRSRASAPALPPSSAGHLRRRRPTLGAR